jgi:hypothetical protein
MIAYRCALLVVAALTPAIAGCGWLTGSNKEKEAAASAYCPTPLSVQDANRLTRFKAGGGRDPRDVAFEAALVQTNAACSISRKTMDISVYMQIAVNAGPSVGGGVTRVPFFVRVMDANGSVIVGRDEFADYKLSAASPRGMSREELGIKIPFNQVSDIGGYKIAVGLLPTPDELEFNRRAQAQP